LFRETRIIEILKDDKLFENIADIEGISLEKTKENLKLIKSQSLIKDSVEILKNPFKNIRSNYIYQPNGS